MGTYCDCGSKFCRCYDVSDLYFVVVMTFMHSGSDCGLNFIKLKMNYNGPKIVFNHFTMIK